MSINLLAQLTQLIKDYVKSTKTLLTYLNEVKKSAH